MHMKRNFCSTLLGILAIAATTQIRAQNEEEFDQNYGDMVREYQRIENIIKKGVNSYEGAKRTARDGFYDTASAEAADVNVQMSRAKKRLDEMIEWIPYVDSGFPFGTGSREKQELRDEYEENLFELRDEARKFNLLARRFTVEISGRTSGGSKSHQFADSLVGLIDPDGKGNLTQEQSDLVVRLDELIQKASEALQRGDKAGADAVFGEIADILFGNLETIFATILADHPEASGELNEIARFFEQTGDSCEALKRLKAWAGKYDGPAGQLNRLIAAACDVPSATDPSAYVPDDISPEAAADLVAILNKFGDPKESDDPCMFADAVMKWVSLNDTGGLPDWGRDLKEACAEAGGTIGQPTPPGPDRTTRKPDSRSTSRKGEREDSKPGRPEQKPAAGKEIPPDARIQSIREDSITNIVGTTGTVAEYRGKVGTQLVAEKRFELTEFDPPSGYLSGEREWELEIVSEIDGDEFILQVVDANGHPFVVDTWSVLNQRKQEVFTAEGDNEVTVTLEGRGQFRATATGTTDWGSKFAISARIRK